MRRTTSRRISNVVVIIIAAAATSLPVPAPGLHARTNVVVERNREGRASARHEFRLLDSPSADDLATGAELSIAAGRPDSNGGDVGVLRDGRVPGEADRPRENFFFDAGTPGGRLVVDLGSPRGIDRVNTYSWHPGGRGPQVYVLWASRGDGDGFVARPEAGTEPAAAGWTRVASVDTRPESGEPGGQYAVSIFDSDGALGPYRFLLFDVSPVDASDRFGNTFFSEIDIVAGAATVSDASAGAVARFETIGGAQSFTIDTTGSPDLTDWARDELAPVVIEWYPKIVELLPSDGYDAPESFSITISDDIGGVAAAGGTRIRCSGSWFRRNIEGEAKGAVVHELVHVVQRYSRGRGDGGRRSRPPGWLVEGIADYIRWFLYEPETGGARITRRNLDRARYDASYRISANFLDWVSREHDEAIVPRLNAALRDGAYDGAVWKERTGSTLDELGDAWKASLAAALAAADPGTASTAGGLNALSDAEREGGWKLLFDGRSLDGWSNFRQDGVRPGWQVRDGALVCADPQNAGDLCTSDEYDWFELRLEYNISEGGNSGIIYHATDAGRYAWNTGPEVQLQDNANAKDPQLCGWLYALYEPPADPRTGRPLDATRPAGEWNEVRLLVAPEKCEHWINGVKYFEYVLGSADFKERVAGSKFRGMEGFARSVRGWMVLQGDHGVISFRNLKIRPITPPPLAAASPDSWSRFRGPGGAGSSAATGLPVRWSDGDGVLWRTSLPGAGSSSPIVSKDRIFVTCYSGVSSGAENLESLERHLVAVDRGSGDVVWKRSIAARQPETPYRGLGVPKHGYASSTPVADGERVYVFFGASGVFAFDFEGNRVWSSEVAAEPKTHDFGSASSPVLLGDNVIVPASVECEAIIAYDRRTGLEAWRTPARGYGAWWGTPIVVDVAGEPELVVSVPDELWGLNPENGKLRWYAESLRATTVCPSATAANGIVYAIGGRDSAAVAVRLGGRGDVTRSHVAWRASSGSFVTSPVFHEGHLYWVSDRGEVRCLKADTGEEVFRQRLEGAGTVYASLVAADGALYAVSRRGGTFVLAAKPGFQLLARNTLASDPTDFNASPVVDGRRLLLRSNRFLYAIGTESTE